MTSIGMKSSIYHSEIIFLNMVEIFVGSIQSRVKVKIRIGIGAHKARATV
jgi:hypothetical protein